MNHPIASKNLEILKSICREIDARTRRNSKPDATSSSQGRLKDTYPDGLIVGDTKENLSLTDRSGIISVFLHQNVGADQEKKKYQRNLKSRGAQKREANAQRTQVYHSERESLMSSFSRDLEATGKSVASRCSGKSENSKARNSF